MREEGRTWPGKFFVLSVLFDAEAGESRLGIITSRRVGGAVGRVRARRLLRGQALDCALHLSGIAEKLLPEPDWRGILQMSATGFDYRHELI